MFTKKINIQVTPRRLTERDYENKFTLFQPHPFKV